MGVCVGVGVYIYDVLCNCLPLDGSRFRSVCDCIAQGVVCHREECVCGKCGFTNEKKD